MLKLAFALVWGSMLCFAQEAVKKQIVYEAIASEPEWDGSGNATWSLTITPRDDKGNQIPNSSVFTIEFVVNVDKATIMSKGEMRAISFDEARQVREAFTKYDSAREKYEAARADVVRYTHDATHRWLRGDGKRLGPLDPHPEERKRKYDPDPDKKMRPSSGKIEVGGN